jgi:peptide/nickel transport system permease protein
MSRGRMLRQLAVRRAGYGLLTLFIVSIIVFVATQVLPGNAATAVLGRNGTPQRIHALEHQLNLNQPIYTQYWHWLSNLLTGDAGTSLANGRPVFEQVGSPLANSAVLIVFAAVISSVVGVGLGVLAAARNGKLLDNGLSLAALSTTALPEFVVGIALIMVFSTLVLNVLPAVSVIPPGGSPFENLEILILPIATLVLITVPYTFRMSRGAMVEALSADYVELATLKGLPRRRILFVHALKNAWPPIIQVIGLNLLYLAGGIVVVENVFNYPGIGQLLVSSVDNRDIPMIQFIVLSLAAFYVVTNIATDLLSLAAAPRRRTAASR